MITGRTLGFCIALALCAWAYAEYQDSDRRKQLANSQPTAAVVVLGETGIKAGKAVTTEGGVFTVRVDSVSGTTARLIVSARTGDVYRFDKVQAGRRLVIPAPDALYDVDVISIRSNMVRLAMSRRR